MSETHFFVTVACLVCLGLSIQACVPHKSLSSKYHMYSKGHKPKSSCSQQNQLIANTAEVAMVPTQIHYPTPHAPVSSGDFYLRANDAPRIYYSVPQSMGGPVGVYTKPYRYLRKVRSMGKNQYDSKVKDDIMTLLPHDVDLRDDVVKSRLRRDGDDATLLTETHQPMDPNTTPSRQDPNFVQSEKISNSTNNRDEDENSSRDSQGETLESVESSESSVELLERFREQMPWLYQRLELLRKLIANSSSSEEDDYDWIPNPFYEEPYADSEHHSDATETIAQPKKLNEATPDDLLMTVSSTDESIAGSVNHGDVEHSSTFTTPALQDHDITAANSYS